jgi:starch phosphorylase
LCPDDHSQSQTAVPALLSSALPEPLAALAGLAIDLRWTWSHEADSLWQRIDADAWAQTRNPWTILQDASEGQLRALAADPNFSAELQRLVEARAAYLGMPGWFATRYDGAPLGGIAYFSMEFGLGAALPLYAGGLGVVAGDYLKTASDLGVPAIGIGLLFQEGYFRQVIDAGGWQQEAYPNNDPGSLPIRPALGPDGAWLHIRLDLPGRNVRLRVWQAQIGRVSLYLLDANDPVNRPADRAITERLYTANSETRLLQEIVLGVAGWRVVEAVAPDTEICHLNEGHTAFAVIERARRFQHRTGRSFREAFWATRAGNVFTTHTSVAAGFDRFSPALIDAYAHYLDNLLADIGIPRAELLGLGRADPDNPAEPFNMAYLAMRGSALSIGVSRQHGRVSRRIMRPLFPRWPDCEVPVDHITNGVHVPTWDSPDADRLWTASCGKERWRCAETTLTEEVATLSDTELWAMRGTARQALVVAVRHRLRQQLAARGHPPAIVGAADQALDPNILTLGFARRFTAYKRPNLLLHDPDRLRRLLTDPLRPAQLILAGKAHPADDEGKRMIRDWILLARDPGLRQRIVFVEDYDLTVAQELVQGVDVWVNTPRRPWEACGTSGMKILVNGGLNLSVPEGWWEEAYGPELGWAVGDGEACNEAARDNSDALDLYDILEGEVVPEFYARDASGLPRSWLARVRKSLARLTPTYSSTRMLHEHIEQLYLPAAAEFRRRTADGGAPAAALREWESRLRRGWSLLHIGESVATRGKGQWQFSVPVHLGEIGAEDVRVELFAEAAGNEPAPALAMRRGAAIAGSANGHIYLGAVAATRPATDYTVRIIPACTGVRVPAELELIRWQK